MAFPTTFVDLQNAVIAKARLDPVNDLSKVKDWINQIYTDVVVETEANVTSTSVTLTAHTATYSLATLAAGVVRIKEMYVTPASGGSQFAPLQLATLDYILRKRQGAGGTATATGYATHYALSGYDKLDFYPTPQSADTLTIYYVALPTALSGNTDVPILVEPYASKVLEYGALAEAGDWKGDPATTDWRQMYMMWMQKYRAHLTRRAGGQPGQFNVFPGGSFPPHDPSTDNGWGY